MPRFASKPPRAPRARHTPAHAAPAPRKRHSLLLSIAIPLLAAGIALLVGAGRMYVQNMEEYDVGIREYHEVAKANVIEDIATGRPLVDFEALRQQNPDTVGWVQIPNTPVNYPVCQASDNETYLERTFLGQYNLAGTIFMDYRSSALLDDWNTVIYGHHLQNGEMFAQVAAYSNQEAFDTLTNLYYVSPSEGVKVLLPLCTIVVSGYDVDAVQFDFPSQQQFEVYVQSLLDRSSARSATASARGLEHIYMLSTCSYGQQNERTILVCVDYGANEGAIVDATQSMDQIQAAAESAAAAA